MSSTDAFVMLLDEQTGTYLLRENSNNELRFSVRSKLPKSEENATNNVKLVGHIVLRKDESGGWNGPCSVTENLPDEGKLVVKTMVRKCQFVILALDILYTLNAYLSPRSARNTKLSMLL